MSKSKQMAAEMTRMLHESGKGIAQLAANSAFEFWQRKDFRLYVDFPHLSQTEQDRMFNEFEVSVLGLFYLQLEGAMAETDKDYAVVLRIIRDEMVDGFLEIMSEAGVEKRYVKQWKVLIDMRLKEYQEDLKLAKKESSKWDEFKGDEDARMVWARIETITIDCLSHIRRGDVKEGDPLWKLIRKWLVTLDTQLHPIIEHAKGEQTQKEN